MMVSLTMTPKAGKVVLMDIALVFHTDVEDADTAMAAAQEVAEHYDITVLGPVSNDGAAYVGANVEGLFAVALTTLEILALRRGHTDMEAYTSAQEKLAAAMQTEPEPTYLIRMFVQEEGHPDHRKVMATGLTLEEAQERCQREDAHGDGWFEGYEEEN